MGTPFVGTTHNDSSTTDQSLAWRSNKPPLLFSAPCSKGIFKHKPELHAGPKKAESLLVVECAHARLGLAALLNAKNMPGMESGLYICGWRRQDVKHVLIFCLESDGDRGKMLEAGPKCLMSHDLLDQYCLAQ